MAGKVATVETATEAMLVGAEEVGPGAVEVASADMVAVMTEMLRDREPTFEDRILAAYDGGMGTTVFIFERFTEAPVFPEVGVPYLQTSEGAILRAQARFIGGDNGGYWLHISGVLASFMHKNAPEKGE